MRDICEACGENIAKVKLTRWEGPYVVELLMHSEGGDCPDHPGGLADDEVERMTGVDPILAKGRFDEVDFVEFRCYSCSWGANQAEARGLCDEPADLTDIGRDPDAATDASGFPPR